MRHTDNDVMTVDGGYDDWEREFIDVEIMKEHGSFKQTALNYIGIKAFLEEVAAGKKNPSYGVLMQIPFAETRDCVVVGCSFAALLLREYQLCRDLIKLEKPFQGKGLIVGALPSVMGWDNVLIYQLFLADMNIPKDVIEAVNERIRAAKDFEYDPHRLIFQNNLLEKLDKEFFEGTTFYGSRAPFGDRFDKLMRKTPEVFKEMFRGMTDDRLCLEGISGISAGEERANICRIVYRNFPEEYDAVLRYFSAETKYIYNDVMFLLGSKPVPDYYLEDLKTVRAICKSRPRYLRMFGRLLMWVTIRFKDEKAGKILTSLLKSSEADSWKVSDVVLLYDRVKDEVGYKELSSLGFVSITPNEYMIFVNDAIALFEKITGKGVELNSSCALWNSVTAAIKEKLANIDDRNANPFGGTPLDHEEEMRSFRLHLKRFIGGISSFTLKKNIDRYEKMLFDYTDEELLLQNFRKGILNRDRIPQYIETAKEAGKFSLIPCLIGNM